MRVLKVYLFSIILLIATVLSLRAYYLRVEENVSNFVENSQLHLNHSMESMLKDQQKVLSFLADHHEAGFKELFKLQTKYPFFLYKGGKLVFWNDEVLLPEVKFNLEKRWQFFNAPSGQYIFLTDNSTDRELTLLFVCTLYTNYAVSNDYIAPFYNPSIFTQDNITLFQNDREDAYVLTDLNDEALFYLQLSPDFKNHKQVLYVLILIVESLLFLFIILLLWSVSSLLLARNLLNGIVLMFFGLIVLKLVMWLVEFPFQSAKINLFNPKYFASSILNPSFGVLLINCVLVFVFAAFILKILLYKKHAIGWQYNRLTSIFISFVSYTLFLLIYGFIESIYRHSQWGMDIFNAINLNLFKALSLLTFLGFAIAIYFIQSWLHQWMLKSISNKFSFILDQFIALFLFIAFCWLIKAPFLWVGIVVSLLNLIVYYTNLNQNDSKLSFINFIYLFVVVSAISAVAAWSTYHMEGIQRANEQNRLANRILNDNDVLAEYLISQMHESLLTDKQIQYQFLLPLTPYNSVANKIEKYYLSDYFEKYEKEITIYDGGGNALYPTKAEKFQQHINISKLTNNNLRAGDYLYLLRVAESSNRSKKYVYLFDLVWSSYTIATICVELTPKKVQPDNVFPELLVDKRFIPDVKEVPYNYALYQNDTLSYKVGTTNFPDHLISGKDESNTSLIEEINQTEFDLRIIQNQSETVVFAAPQETFLGVFSKFSFFFIICFSVVLSFSFYYLINAYVMNITIGLSAKIQLFFSLAFLIPLISISVSTISFVNATFLQDIVKNYQERISRVGDHLTSVLMRYNVGDLSKEDLQIELLNTTKIVNSDLNIYNLSGKRILTSQPQIFEKNLLSDYINPAAYTAIKYDNNKLFTLEEQIGELDYKTAYNAIYSYTTGELLAILASPFFKSSKEYDLLLANLLTNVFNIFVASFIVFLLLAYAATRILTKPLSLLKNKLAKVNLSETNEPLRWPVDDEIGLLITEYNQMLLKLEKSRQALSRTEKESAWREMAQQVAHEIKNPLTPMKLSLQHLLMRIDNGEGATPEASNKIKSILSQVDNLSDIATSFSSFAKMPIPENERTNINEVLSKVVSLFKMNEQSINLNLVDREVYAFVDPKLLERIFNNMLINALQSEDQIRPIKVTISMQLFDLKVIIHFNDNGTGISEENLQKIFLPNFTTKEEGSGIGLAIAKRGIEYAGGKIWAESVVGTGSDFYIELKRMN